MKERGVRSTQIRELSLSKCLRQSDKNTFRNRQRQPLAITITSDVSIESVAPGPSVCRALRTWSTLRRVVLSNHKTLACRFKATSETPSRLPYRASSSSCVTFPPPGLNASVLLFLLPVASSKKEGREENLKQQISFSGKPEACVSAFPSSSPSPSYRQTCPGGSKSLFESCH